MGLISKVCFIFFVVILTLPQNSYSGWQGPVEIFAGSWGQGDNNFGIEHGDTSDRLPWLTAVLFNGNIVISDEVNEREVVYSSTGALVKVVSWYIPDGAGKKVNPEYSTYKYWDVQGYTPEGNIWIRIKNYLLKSPTGQLIKTTATRPLELGVVNERPFSETQYRITIKYPDKTYELTTEGTFMRYMRDTKGYVYGVNDDSLWKFDQCGKQVGELLMPEDQTETVTSKTGKSLAIPVQYGQPVIAPNGDVYTWKKSMLKYSIVKWTWKDDPNVPTGPDAPTGLSVAASINGLYLTWTASPNDPGCVTGYEVVRATSAGGVFSTVATVEKGVVKYNDTSAAAGTTYYYKVRAKAARDSSKYTAVVSGKR